MINGQCQEIRCQDICILWNINLTKLCIQKLQLWRQGRIFQTRLHGLIPLSDNDTELDSNSENVDASTWSLDTYVVIFFNIWNMYYEYGWWPVFLVWWRRMLWIISGRAASNGDERKTAITWNPTKKQPYLVLVYIGFSSNTDR